MVNKNPKAKSALDLIRSHHGSAAVFGGDEDVSFNVSSTSTGSLNLDDAIGCGGIPDGRIVLWSGPESSGKTLGSLCFAKKKQQDKKRILFIDAEFTWDKNWVAKLGVNTDPSLMMVAQESSGIKIFDLLCGKPPTKTRKTPVPGILSDEIITQMKEEGTPLGAIILDSINMVQPPIEEDMQTGDQQIGALSRFLPPVFRRLTPLLGKYGVPLIIICQARTNIGQMGYGDPLTVSGGKALMHAASLWLDSRKISSTEIYSPDDTEQAMPIGHQIRTKVRKNKVGPPSRKAEITIYYEKGIDLRPELVDQGIARGLIKHEGNTLYYSGFAGGKVVGRNNAVTEIFSNKELQKTLLADVLAHRQNKAREVKKEGHDFVEDELEDVVAPSEPIAPRKVIDEGGKAKILTSDEAETENIVTVNGRRVNAETGEVLPPAPTQAKPGEDEYIPVTDEEPVDDPEQEVIAILDDNDDLMKDPVAAAEKPVDVSKLSLNALKKMAQQKNLPKWYGMSRDQLVTALTPTAQAKG